MKSCDGCNEKMSIPYLVHEATATRLERINARLWVVILILIFALIASNLAWIIYEKQFGVVKKNFKIECQQDSDDELMGEVRAINKNLYAATIEKIKAVWPSFLFA